MAGQLIERTELFTRALYPSLQLTDYGAKCLIGGSVVKVIGDIKGLRVEIDDEDYGVYPLTNDTWSSVANALSESTWKHPKWHF